MTSVHPLFPYFITENNENPAFAGLSFRKEIYVWIKSLRLIVVGGRAARGERVSDELGKTHEISQSRCDERLSE